MENEKVKEIKKALEHCGEKVTCQGCPEYNNEPVIDLFECKKNLLRKTITLINELESENDRLQNKNYQLEQDLGQCENGYKLELHTARNQLHSANEDLKKAEKRIAELEKENKRLANSITCQVVMPNDKLEEIKKDCFQKIELAKGELLKQFAEKVAKRLININGIKQILDEILKEFLGEEQ